MYSFWLGVLGTLVVEIILLIFKDKTKKLLGTLSLLFEDRVIHLGNWNTYFMKKNEVMQEKANVKRVFPFNRYFGVIDYPTLNRKYEFDATLKQGFIIATYACDDHTTVDLGSFTLELMKGGDVMMGFYSWIIDDRSIGTDYYIWSRKPLDEYLHVLDSKIHGKGVFAKVPLEADRLLGKNIGYEVSLPKKETLTLNGKIIDPISDLKYLNHSCDPNSKFVGDGLFAIRDIERNEEVTIDYEHTEKEIIHDFKCNCNAENCKKQIGKRVE